MENKDIQAELINTINFKVNQFIASSDSAKNSISAVYLFGSILDKTRFKHNSDIDLAFLLDTSLHRIDRLKSSIDSYFIATEIGLSLNRSTDVIILNSAALETAFQILSQGLIVYEKNTDQRIEYEIALKGMYFDFKPFLEKFRAKALSGIAR